MSVPNDISELLSRDAFREAVFRRDSYRWVLRGRGEPIDAHHILERRLWDDGGYYLNNGATLCDDRDVSCDAIRAAASIRRGLLPDHLYRDNGYDKWGNIMIPTVLA